MSDIDPNAVDRTLQQQAIAFQVFEYSLREDFHSMQVLLEHTFTTDPNPAEAAIGIVFAILGATQELLLHRSDIPSALEHLHRGRQTVHADQAIEDALRDVNPDDAGSL